MQSLTSRKSLAAFVGAAVTQRETEERTVLIKHLWQNKLSLDSIRVTRMTAVAATLPRVGLTLSKKQSADQAYAFQLCIANSMCIIVT